MARVGEHGSLSSVYSVHCGAAGGHGMTWVWLMVWVRTWHKVTVD